jgi:hypothetical protein
MTTRVSPVSVGVTDTAYKPAVLIGGDSSLGDESDATYAEQWLSRREGVGEGALVIADFDPYVGGVGSVALRMRFEVANELGATGTRFFMAAYHDGEEVGLYHPPDDPVGFPSAPSTGVIYDISGWLFEQTSDTVTLAEALISGLEIRTRRIVGSDDDGVSDADWMIRVYELNLLVAAALAPPLRRYPPVNNGGFGPTRHWPRSPNRRAGKSY